MSTDKPASEHDPPIATLSIRGLGRIRVRGGHGRETLGPNYRLPLRLNYFEFANSVVGASVEPRPTRAAIVALSERDRRRLVVAIVRLRGASVQWRALYGTHLSLNERFFAVMRWTDERDHREVLQRLRRVRVQSLPHLDATVRAANANASKMAMRPLRDQLAPLLGMNARRPPFSIVKPSFSVLKLPNVALMPPLYERLLGRPSVLNQTVSDLVRQRGPLVRQRAPWTASAALSKHLAIGLDASKVMRSFERARPDLLALARPSTRVMGALAEVRRCMSLTLQPHRFLTDALKPFTNVQNTLGEIGAFVAAWSEDPLWFLLQAFGMRTAGRLRGLSPEQVEEALLEALERVVRDDDFVPALRVLVQDAPYLNDLQREWLDHALEHAEQGEYNQAVPPFFTGLEGALSGVALDRSLIPKEGKLVAAELVIKRLDISDDYTTFVIQRVYGGPGNAFRHGRADSGARRQTLYAIVALVGWVDAFMELRGMSVLAELLAQRLPAAIEGVAPEQRLLVSR